MLMCKNSFGPWALLSGPRTPVIRNCALGNFSPSIPMKGIEPPSPYEHALLPKKVVDAFSTARSSQGASAGASQPAAVLILSKRTCAPYGGLLSRSCFSFSPTPSVFSVGGSRTESLRDVCGRSTLPACPMSPLSLYAQPLAPSPHSSSHLLKLPIRVQKAVRHHVSQRAQDKQDIFRESCQSCKT